MRQLTEEQFDERDKILEPYFCKDVTGKDWFSGVRCFKGLTVDVLKTLVRKGYADPEHYKNSAPSIAEFIEFCEKHPEFRLHGFAVDRKRSDARIDIEGIETHNLNTSIEDLLMFRFADDFCVDTTEREFFCWYD